MLRKIACNSLALAVSMLVLLVGTAFGDPIRERPIPRRPPPQQREPAEPAAPVVHDTKFHRVPDSKLEIRATTYDGSVNGKLTVEVRNAGKTAEKFSATGLYFVPQGDPDTAPQRLGAVGPMQQAGANANDHDGGKKETKELEIAAGATVVVTLDVFCIDSHRGSPGPSNAFDVGATRMPKELATTIESSADMEVAAQKSSGAAAPRPAAKSAIQGKVWESRDRKWIKLDGEGKQEAAKH